MYRINPHGGVIRLGDGAAIPADPRNADWQEYLAWAAAGNAAQPEPLDDLKRRRRAEVEAELARRLDLGMSYGGKPLQIDEASQRNIIAKSQRAEWAVQGLALWDPNFAWRMGDNSYLPLPAPADMMALADAADTEVTRLKWVAFGHKDAIDALQSASAIAAYDIGEGWD